MTELSRVEAAVGLRDFAPLLEGAENAGTTRFAGAALGVLPTQGLRASAKRHGSGVYVGLWGNSLIFWFGSWF